MRRLFLRRPPRTARCHEDKASAARNFDVWPCQCALNRVVECVMHNWFCCHGALGLTEREYIGPSGECPLRDHEASLV